MTALKKGFTLIELLIVIAILGVLAVVVLVAINPAQQLARTRDAGRKSSIAQLGHAVEAFATTHSGTYPATAGAVTWADQMVTAGEISTVPGAITATGYTACTTDADNGWCYVTGTVGTQPAAIVYAKLESTTEVSNCDAGETVAWFVYSSLNGRAGRWCNAAGEPGLATFTAGFTGWDE